MDSPSEQGKPSPEPTYLRPPGLEFGRGLAIFSLVFGVFAMAQMCLLVERVYHLSPALRAQGFTLRLLEDSVFQEAWQAHARNGDVVSFISLGAGAIGLAILLLLVRGWKKANTVQFLALHLPPGRKLLGWLGLFAAFFTLMEVTARFLPGLDSAFMQEVRDSMTNYPMMVLGIVLAPALFEELLFRGLLFGSLRYLMDQHAAVALTAGVFTLVHPQYNWQLQLLYLLPMSIFLGYARAKSGSTWTCVLLHALNNGLSMALPQG